MYIYIYVHLEYLPKTVDCLHNNIVYINARWTDDRITDGMRRDGAQQEADNNLLTLRREIPEQ